jgi:hypothetical protein
MLWEVSDDGKIRVRMSARGPGAQDQMRTMVRTHLERVTEDMTQMGIEVVTDELRFRTYKTSDDLDVFWRAHVPSANVVEAREYLTTLSISEAGG